MRTSRRRRALRAVALLATLALTAACFAGDDPPPPLRLAGDVGPGDAAGFGKGGQPLSSPRAVTTYTLCVEGEGVQIDRITLRDPEALELVDWGVRVYNPTKVGVHGTYPGPVLSDPTYTQEPVTTRCDTERPTELKIGVKRTSEVGITHGFDVFYPGGSLFVPFRITLCGGECPDDDSDLP